MSDAINDILATIGVNGIEDKYVVGRAGAKSALQDLFYQETLALIGEDVPEKDFGCNHNYLRATLRARAAAKWGKA